MRKAILILVIYASLSLLNACFFSDSEIYRVEPVADDPPEVSVLSNLDTLDKPRVNDSLLVDFEIEVVNGEFYLLEALISDGVVHSSDTASGSFWIFPSQSDETGLDTLYMDIYHSSNSNSLADRTGWEASITYRKYAIDFSEEVKK